MPPTAPGSDTSDPPQDHGETRLLPAFCIWGTGPNLRGEVLRPPLLPLRPDLLRRDQLLHRQVHRLHVRAERLGDLLAALAGLLLDVGEQAVTHLLDLRGRALAAVLGSAHAHDLDSAAAADTGACQSADGLL